MKIMYIVGARPNFIKIAGLLRESENNKEIEYVLVHTGQHYSQNMNDVFFDELCIPYPDFNLNIGSCSHAQQTAKIMESFEPILIQQNPDIVVVVGDVNSTLACSLVSSKLGIKVAHVESGLRSFDRSMPEEINRIVVDAISDIVFVSESSGMDNLRREGVCESKIHFVGNVMIDTLIFNKQKFMQSTVLDGLNLQNKKYIVVTCHRPSNVDNYSKLKEILLMIGELSEGFKIVLPVHPRFMNNIKKYKLENDLKSIGHNLLLLSPLGYMDFMKIISESKMVITDSGGVQEETTVLGIPCFTIRNNTERPATITTGTNHLVQVNFKEILEKYDKFMNKKGNNDIPYLWDGKTSKRIIDVLFNKGKN
jgi:UDP-N-acetylglucosamine 2-epimerase (non-hydrolysing)